MVVCLTGGDHWTLGTHAGPVRECRISIPIVRWMRDISERLQSKGAILALTVVAGAVFVVAVMGTIAFDNGQSAFEAVTNSTVSTTTAPDTTASTSTTQGGPLEGFEGVTFTVTNTNGEKR